MVCAEPRCAQDQFACLSGRMQCIPLDWRCDGWTACEDKSDEMDCPRMSKHKYKMSFSFFLNNYNYISILSRHITSTSGRTCS